MHPSLGALNHVIVSYICARGDTGRNQKGWELVYITAMLDNSESVGRATIGDISDLD
jgi:hypothetical protein